MRVKEIQFFNRAPFNNLYLNFDNQTNLILFTGMNGSGKTTIISYIVDAFFEIAKNGFPVQFGIFSNNYYRVSSPSFVINNNEISFVYIRFENERQQIDYIDIRNLESNYVNYETNIKITDPFTLDELTSKSKIDPNFKLVSTCNSKEIFNSQIITYFPSYRYEQPGYLTDTYKIKLKFETVGHFTELMKNKIEAVTEIPEIANWIMDIILDNLNYPNDKDTQKKLLEINSIIKILLEAKYPQGTRIGLGKRDNGFSRISIAEEKTGIVIYPSIFNMSAGELTLISLFCELLRQSEKISKDCSSVEGIVLIDEIDKHLHISLQINVLPKLLKLFPKLQFIITSHSPFFNFGIEKTEGLNYSIYDLDADGCKCLPNESTIFLEFYNIFVSENQRYATQLQKLRKAINSNSKPLIITEGKSDWKHLERAKKELKLDNLDIEIFHYDEALGDINLFKSLSTFSGMPIGRDIIGVFDHDNEKIVNEVHVPYRKFGNNIYAFCLPVVNESIYGSKTSIEHYYNEKDLKKPDPNSRRLFLGNEFNKNGISKDSRFVTKYNNYQNKIKYNGVIDDKVYRIDDFELENNIALSKDDFASLVFNEADDYAKDFDFTNFNKIYDVINQIIQSEIKK